MLHFQFELDQPQLPLQQDAVRHLIARIVPPAPNPMRELPPLDLAVVIDASGSMSGAPLEAAKEATLRLARELPTSTRLTIISFADDVVVHADGLLLDEPGRTEIRGNLAGLQTRGTTNLHAGWQTACTLLASDDAAGRRRHVVVLSDGHANRGLCAPNALARESSDRLEQGISTSCVGIGDGYSPSQLSALADNGGGECHDAENAREIVEILLGEVLSLSEVVAEHLQFVIDVPDGIHASELSGMPSIFDGRRLMVSAGAVRAGVERTIVVRLQIPASFEAPVHGGMLVGTGHLEWREPGSPERHVGERIDALALRTNAAIERPTLEHAQAVLVAWQAHVVRHVTELNRDGDFGGLERLWQNEFEKFTAYANAHRETRDYVRTIRRMRNRAARPMPERSRKQAFDMATKGARQAHAYYSMDKGSVAEQFDDS